MRPAPPVAVVLPNNAVAATTSRLPAAPCRSQGSAPCISTTIAKRTANKRITTEATAKRIWWFKKVQRHPRAGGPINIARLLSRRAAGARERRAHHRQTGLRRSRPRLTQVAGRGQKPRNDDQAFRPGRRVATPRFVPSVSYGGFPIKGSGLSPHPG